MTKELVISANRHETRVAVMEDDQLVEVYFQRSNEYSLAGSIHKGRVTRVLPGMQSAFVDLGLERDTFLYVSDFLEEHEDIDKVGDEKPERGGRERGRDRDRDRDRERRGHAPQAAPAAAAPEAAGEEAAAGGEALAAAPAAAGETEGAEPATEVRAAASQQQSPEQGGGHRDDRRRGRRRRRRGAKGFPESKYAAGPAGEEPEAGEAEAEGEGEAEVETAAVSEEALEAPLVLPGESLRKYRGVSPEAAAPHVAAHEEPRHEEPKHEEPAAAAQAPVVAEAAPAAAAEHEPLVPYDQPSRYPLDNAVPDAPIHHPVLEPEAYTPELERRAGGPPPLPAFTAAEPVEAAEEEDRDVEDRDIQAMILDEIEGLTDEGAEAEAEAAQLLAEGGGEEEGPRDPGVEASPLEGEQPATAQVRERSGRMPHRMGRRMRRRGGRDRGDRGGERGERGEARGESRGEAREEGQESGRREERTVSRPTTGQPLITDLLKEGQEIIVQIAKEPLGQKGARITSHIALPGRYVVFMPTLEHMGVSRKIASDEERHRLKKILQGRRPGAGGGFITRTAAEGRTEEEIAQDMEFLYKMWTDIKNKAERKPAPLLLHHDLNIVERILRDQLTDNFKAIWIDNEEIYEHVLSFVQRFQPALVNKVKMYTREAPIFDAFSVTSELEKALRPKVWLKSGGYIVINQTEALVAIDINTGKFVGKSNRLEDTIVKTNTEAIKEIVRQIRLRDLGGIIVIDFIDMDERKNRQKVMQALEEAMRVDRAPYKILQFNDFGLVAITRKRVKQSRERTLCAPCPHCDGAGYIKSVQTVVSEILTEARKVSSSIEGKDVMLRVHPDVAKVLKSNQNKYLEELEETMRRPVLVKSDPLLHHEKFDLA